MKQPTLQHFFKTLFVLSFFLTTSALAQTGARQNPYNLTLLSGQNTGWQTTVNDTVWYS